MRLNPTTVQPTTNSELDELITTYGRNNDQKLKLEKVVKAQGADIKRIMLDSALDSYETDEYKANCTITVKEDFNMDKLLEVIHTNEELAAKVIKTKEYVDMDVLEDLLYKETIDTELLVKMNTCREIKETAVLRVTKRKK